MTFATSLQPVIMQIIPELGPGGAEQSCIDVATELTKRGSLAIVVSHGGARIHELERAGVTHVNLPVHSKNPLLILKNVQEIKKLILRYNVNIIHVRSRAPAWSAYWACQKMPQTRFMTTCHAPYNISGKLKRLYNSVISRGERVIANSETVAQYLMNNYPIDPGIIRIIHRGVALEKFHPTAVTPQRMIQLSSEWRIPDGVNIIMLPGRLTRWKGHHVLIDAMARLGRKDLFCVMIGSDQGRTDYRKELEETIEQKGLGGQIRIVNHCHDMPAAYMLATVVISASTDPEGFGRIAVEGQAMGRPVVASDHGGSKETIKPGQTGWLVPPGDSIALSRAIEEALALTASQRAMLATRAMSHVAENFTREQMVDKTLSVYGELLSRHMLAPAPQSGPFQVNYAKQA